MRVIRLALFTLVILIAQLTLAKGPAQRIVISGPGIDSELVVTDIRSLRLLSMAGLEDFAAGPIPSLDENTMPADVGQGYELVRQFEVRPGEYRNFDRVRYYPGSGRGYVFYVGIEGGASEYDGRWFYANPQAEAAFQLVLEGPLEPYLLAVMDGESALQVLNPETLDAVGAFESDKLAVSQIQSSWDGKRLFVQSDGGAWQLIDLTGNMTCATLPEGFLVESWEGPLFWNAAANAIELRDGDSLEIIESFSIPRKFAGPVELYPSPDGALVYMVGYDGKSQTALSVFSVADRVFRGPRMIDGGPYTGVWNPIWNAFYLVNGSEVLAVGEFGPEIYERRSVKAEGLEFDAIMEFDGRILGLSNGGLRVIEMFGASGLIQRHRERHFSQLLYGGSRLYAVESNPKQGQMVTMDVDTRNLTVHPLPGNVTYLAYIWLHPDVLTNGKISRCAT